MKTSLSRLLLCLAGLAPAALADVPHTFTDNTPAEAAEVNANFDNLDTRVSALEGSAPLVLVVNCGKLGEFGYLLQEAIDAVPPSGASISTLGPCDGIVIENKRNIELELRPHEGLRQAASGGPPLSIINSQGIVIRNLLADETANSTSNVYVEASSVEFEGLQAVNDHSSDEDWSLHIRRASNVVFRGLNRLDDGGVGAAQGLLVEQGSTATVEGTLETSGVFDSIVLRSGGRLLQDAGGDAGNTVSARGFSQVLSGSLLQLENASMGQIIIENGTVDLRYGAGSLAIGGRITSHQGLLYVDGATLNGVIARDGSQATLLNVTLTGSLAVLGGSSMFVNGIANPFDPAASATVQSLSSLVVPSITVSCSGGGKAVTQFGDDSCSAHSMVKQVTDVGGAGPGGAVQAAGDVITYSIVVSNDGNTIIAGGSLSDPLLQGANGTLGAVVESINPDGVLQRGETWTYTGTYTVPQTDIDDDGDGDGDIDNTASFTSPLGTIEASAAVPISPGPP